MDATKTKSGLGPELAYYHTRIDRNSKARGVQHVRLPKLLIKGFQ